MNFLLDVLQYFKYGAEHVACPMTRYLVLLNGMIDINKMLEILE